MFVVKIEGFCVGRFFMKTLASTDRNVYNVSVNRNNNTAAEKVRQSYEYKAAGSKENEYE